DCGNGAALSALLGPLAMGELIGAPCWWAWLTSMIMVVVAGWLAPYFPNVRDRALAQLRAEVEELRVSIRAERGGPRRRDQPSGDPSHPGLPGRPTYPLTSRFKTGTGSESSRCLSPF